MPIPPHEPKTLSAARDVIKSLRAQLAGHGPPAGTKPIPKTPPGPAPNPDPSRPGSPGTNRLIDLSSMAPAQFTDFLSRCENRTLKHLLSLETAKPGKEQDEHVVAKLYTEIKKRGRSA